MIDSEIKQGDFFDLFFFDKKIRGTRNEIAGHPTNGKKNGFYFISKGCINKDGFTYAGYTPDFRSVNVDLKFFIAKQSDFTVSVLLSIQNYINEKIEMKKKEHKNKKLSNMVIDFNRNMQLIYRGITDQERNFQGKGGIENITNSVCEIKNELNLRYNNLTSSIMDSFRLIDYILNRLSKWQDDNQLLGNNDAEIFHDSLGKQLNELEDMLKEIDEKFNS